MWSPVEGNYLKKLSRISIPVQGINSQTNKIGEAFQIDCRHEKVLLLWTRRYSRDSKEADNIKETIVSSKEASCFTPPEFGKHVMLSRVIFFQSDADQVNSHLGPGYALKEC